MINKAKKRDAARCIGLLRLAMEDIAFTLTGANSDGECDEILCSFFVRESNRISYENIYTFSANDEIVGAMCAYFGGDASNLDEPIKEHLRRAGASENLDAECFEDEFDIDSSAVSEDYRNQGIATALIGRAYEVAKERNFKKLALIVDVKKPKTKLYYERLGFKEDAKILVNNHEFNHLVKDVK